MEAVAERLDWWAELFEPACIAWAASPDEAHAFVLAGADFILLSDTIWADPRGASTALAEIGQAMRQAHILARETAKKADKARRG